MNGGLSSEQRNDTLNGAASPKITNWKKEPTVGVLMEDLEAARPSHDTHIQNVQRWNNLNKVQGSARPKKIKGRSSVQPKLIRRQAEWRYSALTEPFNSSQDLFTLSPVTWEDGDAAEQNQILLNWQFRTKINRVNFIDNYVRACVDEGTAIVRVGWHRQVIQVEQEMPVWSYLAPSYDEEIQHLQQAIALKESNPRGYEETTTPEIKAAVDFYLETNQVTVAVKSGTEKVKVDKVIDNRPLVEVMNPENVYFDPSCGGDINKAGFIIVTFETSQAELRKYPNRYKNLDMVNWDAASPPTLSHDHMPRSVDQNFNFKDPMRKLVVAYEYWGMYDIHGTGELKPIVATWIGETMIRMEENPFPDEKPPFVTASYMPVKRQLLGEPDAELLEDNQNILGAVTRGMIDLLGRSANGQQGFAKGFLDVLNRRRYEAGQDYEFNPNVPPDVGVKEHKYPEIPQSAMLMLTMQNQEAEALTGVKAFSGGLSGEAYGDVATAIRGILDAAAKREMAILRRLADGLVEIGKKICAMNASFLSEKEVVRVTNDEFVEIKREDLAGNFDFEVDISTAEIDNAQAQDLAFMLQTMGNNMDFNMTKMILVKIAKLKRMYDLAHQIENFQPQPDPLVQRAKELEIVRLEKEIEELQSKIDLNRAKALETAANAEQTALDTVEQETGTKHARDIEKQVAQSSGNQSLEVTKALLKPKKPEETAPDVEAAVGFNELSKRMRDSRTQGEPVF